jgi:hypothetical protein
MFSRRDFLQLIPNYSPMQTKSLIDFPPDRFIICTRPLHDDHFLSSPAFIYLRRRFCAKSGYHTSFVRMYSGPDRQNGVNDMRKSQKFWIPIK